MPRKGSKKVVEMPDETVPVTPPTLPKNSKSVAAQQRHDIITMLNNGKSYSAIQKALGCSTRTIAKVKEAMLDPERDPELDRRENNRFSEIDAPQISEEAIKAILEIRNNYEFGARLIYGMLVRTPEKFGLVAAQIPSPASIGNILAAEGLTKRPIGTKDRRFYPYEVAEEHGDVLLMDGKGPDWWSSNVRSYTTTVKDMYSRCFGGVMSVTTRADQTSSAWIQAYYMAMENFYGGSAPNVLQTDNGIGLAIAQGTLPQPARHALRAGSRLVYIPKSQPWRNGRLENNHFRMDREFINVFKHEHAGKRIMASEIYREFASWLNFYNMERPQTSKKNKTPYERSGGIYQPVNMGQIINHNTEYETVPPQEGIMDIVRLVEAGGFIDLWAGDHAKIQDLFAGQYVRLRFFLDPKKPQGEQHGEIIWRSSGSQEPIVIATMNHRVDQKRTGEAITAIKYHDFDQRAVSSASVRIDQNQVTAQIERVGKRARKQQRNDIDIVMDEE